MLPSVHSIRLIPPTGNCSQRSPYHMRQILSDDDGFPVINTGLGTIETPSNHS